MDQSLRDAAVQGSIDALYQSFRDAAEQGNIDALYQSFKAAEQRRTDVLCQSLRDAAKQGSIDDLYALIRRNSDVLDSMDKIPIVETPLHIAASLGHTEFAMEIMKLKPSFARKLNQDGFTPMHLALQKLHELENDDALQRNLTQLVHQLLYAEKDLVRVKGKKGVTLLHYVVETENLNLLDKFLEACPKSLEDVTIQGENVLHIALKNDKVKAFLLLIRWLRRSFYKDANLLDEKLLHWQDDEGNTLLHVAVSRNQPEVVLWLLNRGLFDLKAKNFEGHTVFDILGRQTQVDNQCRRIRSMLIKRRQRFVRCLILFPFSILVKISGAIRRQQRAITDDRRNALLVVAALLLTVTYQAALGPDQQLNEFDCTAPINANGANQYFNCTARSSTEASSPRQIGFYVINTLTYYLANVTLLFLLPPDFIAIVLYFLLGLLFLCYCISTPLLKAYVSTFGVLLLPTFPIFAWLTRAITTAQSKFCLVLFFILLLCVLLL